MGVERKTSSDDKTIERADVADVTAEIEEDEVLVKEIGSMFSFISWLNIYV